MYKFCNSTIFVYIFTNSSKVTTLTKLPVAKDRFPLWRLQTVCAPPHTHTFLSNFHHISCFTNMKKTSNFRQEKNVANWEDFLTPPKKSRFCEKKMSVEKFNSEFSILHPQSWEEFYLTLISILFRSH